LLTAFNLLRAWLRGVQGWADRQEATRTHVLMQARGPLYELVTPSPAGVDIARQVMDPASPVEKPTNHVRRSVPEGA
jgi:hypothetical protein